MGRISTNIGLITGFPIKDTVDQLVALQERPRDLLVGRNEELAEQQTALTDLTALLVSLQLNTNELAKNDLFSQRTVNSTNSGIVSVQADDDPPLGSYDFTAVRQVQSQQLLSSKLASDTSALGGGDLSFRFGGEIDRGISLDLLNDGNGIERGKIEITDRNGDSATIDLSYARNVDDVLEAVNGASGIDVTIETYKDKFLLRDSSGGSGNLKVEEVDGGSTAASLGLDGIDIAADSTLSSDVVGLFEDIDLSLLNDGLGIRFDPLLPDLQFSFRDGTSLEIDFDTLEITGTRAQGTTNAANGINAEVTVVADTEGSSQDGIIVAYQDDPAVLKGNEVATFDEENGILFVKIEEGKTTAADVAAAINGSDEVSKLFTANLASGSSGEVPVSASDIAVLRGPKSAATSTGTLDPNASLTFEAVTGGSDFDGYAISYTHNAGITVGNETVTVDENAKTIVIEINEATSTANNVISAFNDSAEASALFTVDTSVGSNGTGLIDVNNDGVTTAGGAYVEPVPGGAESSLADVLATLNAADPAKLKAEIGAGGEGLVLTDLTSDTGGTFTITGLNDSKALQDLGLASSAVGDTITGTRIFSGLKTTLLSTLDGGNGLELGSLDITDRSGASATLNFSTNDTLEDIIATINLAGLGVEASANDTRDGIQLTDTTGATTSNLIVANGLDGLLTADKLGLAINDAVTSVDGGSLNKQTVSENTLLSSLNGGSGVSNGSFKITDTVGSEQTITINAEVKTIGDLILEIERTSLQIDARINDAGDGIVLIDTADGSETLTIEEEGGNTARDLHILGASTTIDVGGTPTQVIDGSTQHTISLEATDTLQDLRDKINDLGAGVSATIINDGSSVKPFRLNIVSDNAGELGAIHLNASGLGITFEETIEAQDALVLIGNETTAGGQILASSSSNTFEDIVTGIDITIHDTSDVSVKVSVTDTDKGLVSRMIATVETFNRIRERINILTEFDEESGQAGILQGDSAMLRLESDLNRIVTDRILGAGSFKSVAQIGVTMGQNGFLALDESVLKSAFEEDPAAVEQFFTSTATGLSDRFDRVLEQLAGVENSVLVNRSLALSDTIANNEIRIDILNDRLKSSKELLLKSFINSELAIGRIQGDMNAVQSISALPPLT